MRHAMGTWCVFAADPALLKLFAAEEDKQEARRIDALALCDLGIIRLARSVSSLIADVAL
jgi:hypothetical protein